MITTETKTQLDEIFNNSQEVSFNKYVADDNIKQFDEDAKLLAVCFQNADDEKSFLVLYKDVYYIVEEASDQDEDYNSHIIVENDDTEYVTSIYNEDTDEFDETTLTFEETIIYAVQEKMFPEINFYKMTEEDAVKYPLS